MKRSFVLAAWVPLALSLATPVAHGVPPSTIRAVSAPTSSQAQSGSQGSGNGPLAGAAEGAAKGEANLTTVMASDVQKKSVDELLNCKTALEYLPVPEFEAWDYTVFKADGNGNVVAQSEYFDHTKPDDINKLLPNISMDVNVRDLGVDGKVGFWQSDLHHQKIIMDFMKSRTEPIITRNGTTPEFHGYGRIGVGLRLEIDIWSTENKFDGSLVGLAASAKTKTTTGRISAKTIGINNSDVTLSMPFNADLSEGSIQKIIESLAIIKSKLHQATGTTIRPHFLARVQCPPGAKVDDKPQSEESAKQGGSKKL